MSLGGTAAVVFAPVVSNLCTVRTAGTVQSGCLVRGQVHMFSLDNCAIGRLPFFVN